MQPLFVNTLMHIFWDGGLGEEVGSLCHLTSLTLLHLPFASGGSVKQVVIECHHQQYEALEAMNQKCCVSHSKFFSNTATNGGYNELHSVHR